MDTSSRLTVLSVLLSDDLLEDVVGLGTHLHGLGERAGTGGEKHELLEGKSVTGVLSTVDDVESGGGEDVRGLDTSELGNVLVKRDTLARLVDDTRLKSSRLALSAAPAWDTAMETPRMALAPSLPLLSVPSSLMRRSSISFWEVTGILASIKAGAMMLLTLSTALRTP